MSVHGPPIGGFWRPLSSVSSGVHVQASEGLNEAQRQAVDHQGSPPDRGFGAGTGKTTVLTRRYARLLERGLTTDHILALTFTEKAAGRWKTAPQLPLPAERRL